MAAQVDPGDVVLVDGVSYVQNEDGSKALLTKVEHAAVRAAGARTKLEVAILNAYMCGESSRKIAKAAGVSHTQVLRLVRSDQS